MLEDVGSSLTKLLVKLTHNDCCIVSMRRNRTRTISCEFLTERMRIVTQMTESCINLMESVAEQSMFFSFLVSMQVSTQEEPLSGEMIIPDGRNVLILFTVHTREQS